MSDRMRLAEAVREACLAAAVEAFEQGGFSGLCLEGRWELALDAVRALPLAPVVEAHGPGGDEPSGADPHHAPPKSSVA